MRKKNRTVLVIFLCLCLLLQANVSGFADISEGHWAYASVQALDSSGALERVLGISDNDAFFSPRANVSRLEFVEMLVEFLFPGANQERPGSEAWRARETELAASCGLADGSPDAAARLMADITREEAAHLLALALDLRGESITDLKENIDVTDIDAVTPAYRYDVIRTYNAGLFAGCGNSVFNPQGILHRDEEAVLLQRLNDPSCRVPAKGDFVFDNFLFLGDSLISNPHYVSQTFTKKGHQVFAGGGAVTANFLGLTTKRVTVGSIGAMTGSLKDRDFNGIVILLGANDLGQDEASTIMERYTRLIEELLAFSDKPIFVLKVFPVNRAYGRFYGSVGTRTRRTNELNDLLCQYCSQTDGVWFADATGPFTDPDGYLISSKGSSDGLHINSLYYDEFYSAIENALYDTGMFIRPAAEPTA